jgi:hypothetical protein
MDIVAALDWLQKTSLAVQIRDSLYTFPLLESAHVIGFALVFGTIVIVDLRLLGVASAHRPFQRLAADTLKWTWLAFALTAVTGVLMFITNATVYYNNAYFRAKVVLLVLAAVNVGVFELTEGRRAKAWEHLPSAPPLGRVVAVVSLVVWIGVIATGRMIGFTVTRGTAEPAPVEIDLEDLLGFPGDGAPAAPPDQK